MSEKILYEITGDDIQSLKIKISPKQTIVAELGSMVYMEEGIKMETDAHGGFVKSLNRFISGERFFLIKFYNETTINKELVLTTPYPGKIVDINLSKFHGTFICQKNSYLCSSQDVHISTHFMKKLGTGLFGGEGFILQKLLGNGRAFIHSGGNVIEKKLEKGEVLKVDTGCIIGFQQTVNYEIKFIGGIKNTLFGGEGLFFAILKGPGTVYLQSTPFSRLADKIVKTQKMKTEEGGLLKIFKI
jgi:uncharacterized protein (TIGR00266 family)